MRRESDKYQFKEPFGREIRKKMIESQKKTFQGPEKNLKLGQLKPNQLATVGMVATGIIQPERKTQSVKTEKKSVKAEKKPKKAKKAKRKKASKDSSDTEEIKKPVEKKAKKGEDLEKSNLSAKNSTKKISDISIQDFDEIRRHLPGIRFLDNADSLARKRLLALMHYFRSKQMNPDPKLMKKYFQKYPSTVEHIIRLAKFYLNSTSGSKVLPLPVSHRVVQQFFFSQLLGSFFY